MLRCPKCGTDNLLSAVFCRGCGERMNLDEIKPDDFANIGPKKSDTTMQNIIGGAIIGVLLIGFLVGLCFPSCSAPGTSEEGQRQALDKYVSNVKTDVTFTDQEITDLCNALLAQNAGEDSKVKKIAVRCHDDGTVTTYVSTNVLGFLPTTVKCACNVNLYDKSVSLQGGGVKCGLLPLPQGMEENVFWPVKNECNAVLRDLNDKIRELTISEGQATVNHGKVTLE